MPRQTPDYDPLSDELPPELADQYAAEQRRQRLAEAMLGQTMQPLQAPEVKGRFQGAISPWQGLSQIAQAYMLNKGIGASQGRMADIGKQVEADRSGERQRIVDVLAAQQPAIAAPESGGPGRPQMPIDPEERQRRLAEAIVSARYPQNQKLGEFLYSAGEKNLARSDTLEAARQAAREKITAAAEAQRIAEEGKLERSQADRNLKVSLAEINAAIAKAGMQNKSDIAAMRTEAATAPKPMTEQQRVKFEKQITDDFKEVGQAMQSMAEIQSAVKDITGSKGLSAREGLTGYIPAWMQGKEAMTAENRIETLKGKVTQMGKTMATMSGAIGPMAVQEWRIVADAVNSLDPKAGNLTEQLGNIEAQAIGAANRIKDAYDRQYADRIESYPRFASGNIKTNPTGRDIRAGKATLTTPATGIDTSNPLLKP